jgi:hypothetical protein
MTLQLIVLDSHLAKLLLCFEKCKKFGNNFNNFFCFHGFILNDRGFHKVFKSKPPNHKKIQAIVNTRVLTNP